MSTNKSLPGKGCGVLSFEPYLNWLSLLYMGIKCSHAPSILCGIAYGALSLVSPTVAMLLWFVSIIQYRVARASISNRVDEQERYYHTQRKSGTSRPSNPTPMSKPYSSLSTMAKPKAEARTPSAGYCQIDLSGSAEQRQGISPADQSLYLRTATFSRSGHDAFFQDMRKLENASGSACPFVPFMNYWPTYDAMDKNQKAWYFYWRSQVRAVVYPRTDLSYIFVYIYELLSGVGWQNPQEGQNRLLKIWNAYVGDYPKLSHYLQGWMFDFARQYQLPYQYPSNFELSFSSPSVLADMLIDEHTADSPLKLPFDLIDALCEYSLVGSKFYQDGHQLLMREAIPRIVALADAALLQKTQKGILATYGPTRTRKQQYLRYASALCPGANSTETVSVRAYTDKIHLKTYINELVRYGENALRAENNCRGRLRGVELEPGTASLIDAFVMREYGEKQPAKPSAAPVAPKVVLDPDSVRSLRQQSDKVREALKVNDTAVEKQLLTDLKEVASLFLSLSDPCKTLLEHLRLSGWEMEGATLESGLLEAINQASEKHLGCALLHIENGSMIVEDDYRDELEEVFIHPPISPQSSTLDFNTDGLSAELKALLENLTDEQAETLRTLLGEEQPLEQLEKLAEQNMTMPQILMDDLNEVALPYLGEILIDTLCMPPRVLEEYAVPLKQSII